MRNSANIEASAFRSNHSTGNQLDHFFDEDFDSESMFRGNARDRNIPVKLAQGRSKPRRAESTKAF